MLRNVENGEMKEGIHLPLFMRGLQAIRMFGKFSPEVCRPEFFQNKLGIGSSEAQKLFHALLESEDWLVNA